MPIGLRRAQRVAARVALGQFCERPVHDVARPDRHQGAVVTGGVRHDLQMPEAVGVEEEVRGGHRVGGEQRGPVRAAEVGVGVDAGERVLRGLGRRRGRGQRPGSLSGGGNRMGSQGERARAARAGTTAAAPWSRWAGAVACPSHLAGSGTVRRADLTGGDGRRGGAGGRAWRRAPGAAGCRARLGRLAGRRPQGVRGRLRGARAAVAGGR